MYFLFYMTLLVDTPKREHTYFVWWRSNYEGNKKKKKKQKDYSTQYDNKIVCETE